MLIASFQALRSKRFTPPFSVSFWSNSSAILGEESSSHMKFRIVLVSVVSMCGGIPCAFVTSAKCKLYLKVT